MVARKPLAGTVAANVLTYGTGALNVDACRVGTDTERGNRYNGKSPGGSHGDGLTGGPRTEPWNTPAGRWPPNVLFGHAAGCEPAGTILVKGDNRPGSQGRRPGGFAGTGADSGDAQPNGPLYGEAVLEVWDCVVGCPVAELDRQSGRLTSGSGNVMRDSGADQAGNRSATFGAESRPAGTVNISYGDTGGASRFFPAFKYQAKARTDERPRIQRKVLRLRADLSDDDRAYVLAELRKAGVDVA